MKFSILLTLILLTGCGYKKGVTEIVPGQSAPQIDISGRSTSSGILVTLTASNRSKSAYQLLEWNLPKHGKLTTDLFRVNRGISQIQYTGLMYKRAVDDSSYVMIPPGTSMTVEIDLGQFYPLKDSGRYSIKYVAYNQTPDGKTVDTLESNTIQIDRP